MAKIRKSISGAPFPTPVALITTIDEKGRPNIVTLAWVGMVCSDPMMVGVSIRPPRYSHGLLLDIPELVINLPSGKILRQSDFCGTVSGRDTDKFAASGLTPMPAAEVRPPLIAECPVNLEGRVKETIALGTHDLFICEIVASHVDESVLDDRGRVDFGRVSPFIYLAMDYWSLKEKIGYYAFTKKGSK